MTIRPLAAAAGCALALTLTGCDLASDPYAAARDRDRAAAPSRVARSPDGRPAGDAAPTRPELPAATPPPAPAGAGAGARAGTPEAAASAYADAAGNWSAGTLARQYDRMRRLAAGRLATELARSAPDADSVRALRDADQANRAQLVAAARTPSAGGPLRVIVVTREEAVNAGSGELAGARHVVYRATLTHPAAGWRVTSWELLP